MASLLLVAIAGPIEEAKRTRQIPHHIRWSRGCQMASWAFRASWSSSRASRGVHRTSFGEAIGPGKSHCFKVAENASRGVSITLQEVLLYRFCDKSVICLTCFLFLCFSRRLLASEMQRQVRFPLRAPLLFNVTIVEDATQMCFFSKESCLMLPFHELEVAYRPLCQC